MALLDVAVLLRGKEVRNNILASALNEVMYTPFRSDVIVCHSEAMKGREYHFEECVFYTTHLFGEIVYGFISFNFSTP